MKYTIYIISSLLCWGTIVIGQSVQVTDYALEDLRGHQLNSNNITIYEEQAILKLQDVLDYMSLIGSSQYNTTLRNTALESILVNFDPTAKINCNWIAATTSSIPKKQLKKGKQPTCTPKSVLKELSQLSYYTIQIDYQNMEINKSLKKLPNGSYQGQLLYHQQVIIQTTKTADPIKQKKTIVTINFLLKRVLKKFGDKTEKIWEVKFLDMP